MTFWCKGFVFVVVLVLVAVGKASANERYAAFIRKVEKAAILVETDGGSGSGVVTVIDRRKWVLTAFHVVRGKRRARMTSLGDRSTGIIYRDARWHTGYDVAALPLPKNMYHLPTFPLTDGYLRKGAKVYVAAFPKGKPEITHGYITRYGNPFKDPLPSEMYFTAAVRPGSSGGMILSHDGRLAGIATGGFVKTDRYGNKYYGEGIGTPAYVIIDLIRQGIGNKGRF